MKKKLWQASGSGLHPLVEAYTVGDDHIFDQQLIPFDVQASKAHAQMLGEMGVLTAAELEQATLGLNEVLALWEKDEFTINQSQEDGHTAIEQYLTERFDEVGKKIHTGRSRNDQSLVMIRLFMKQQLEEVSLLVDKLIAALSEKAGEYQSVEMPGYTHMQRAMPTTVGTWFGCFGDALSDFQVALEGTRKLVDQNPLGSASGFGITNFPMKRELTTKLLGFAKTQENPLYCGISRGYFENNVLQVLSQFMFISGKFANDMMLFTTSEFGFFSLPAEYTTGSSIMPQKRNYDVFEVMRGNTKVFNSYQSQIQGITCAIGSGYQRELQLTKKPFMMGCNLATDTVRLLAELVTNTKVNEPALKEAMTADLYLTNKVYDLVNDGASFRTAYQQVKSEIGL